METTMIPAADPAMRKALDAAAAAVQSGAPLLIVGETGTGKTTLARHLHRRGSRAREPFVRIESGSALATGPFSDVPQRAAAAAREMRGTLFIDDLELLPRLFQKRLCHFLGDLRRREAMDIQLIAAAHPRLGELVDDGSFSAELSQMLHGDSVTLPPLRERTGDIPAWVALLTAGAPGRRARISEAAMGYLLEYDWPGNVRELKALLERFLARGGEREVIAAEDLPPQIRWFIPGAVLIDLGAPEAQSAFNPMAEDFQYRLIADALRRTWRR